MTVSSLSLSLALLRSTVLDDTVAVLVMVPPSSGALTVTTTEESPLGARFARLQVRMPPTPVALQLQPDPLLLT